MMGFWRSVSPVILWYFILLMKSCQSIWPASEITRSRGHYPPVYCRITNVVLSAEKAKFLYQGNVTSNIQTSCDSLITSVWPFQRLVDMGSVKCDRTFDKGYIFTIYYYHGSNYFHLHYDMMLSLYLALHHAKTSDMTVALLPTVESSRLEMMNWGTPAFRDTNKYWMQLLDAIRGSAQLIPLDKSLLNTEETICFKTTHFGTMKFPFEDKRLVQSYVSFIKKQFDIAEDDTPDLNQPHRIGIITREISRGRAILNEGELVKSVSHLGTADIVEFIGLSFREQVALVQKYSVLVGVNGAGLTNALYLPKTSVAIQLVPYNATVNFREFGIWLSSRGPYLEWHNTHPELSEVDRRDTYFNRVNTKVHVEEFVQLITEALSIVNSRILTRKTEL